MATGRYGASLRCAEARRQFRQRLEGARGMPPSVFRRSLPSADRSRCSGVGPDDICPFRGRCRRFAEASAIWRSSRGEPSACPTACFHQRRSPAAVLACVAPLSVAVACCWPPSPPCSCCLSSIWDSLPRTPQARYWAGPLRSVNCMSRLADQLSSNSATFTWRMLRAPARSKWPRCVPWLRSFRSCRC